MSSFLTQSKMDCPICLIAITKETGVITTSCGHSYHFSCIASWYAKGNTCPCCRTSPTSTEVMPKVEEEDEEEVEFTRAGLDAWLRRRGGTGVSNMPDSVCSEIAGFTQIELNFLALGNGARRVTDNEWRWLLLSHDSTEAPAVADVLNPEE